MDLNGVAEKLEATAASEIRDEQNWYQRLEMESAREREGDQQTRTREWDASTDRFQSIDHEKLKMLSWIRI